MTLKINSGTLSKTHSPDCGWDIHSDQDKMLLPNIPTEISTNLRIDLPKDTVGFIKPRSGLAFRYSINTMAGVIDEGYENEIKVLLINHGIEPYKVNKGDRIAQLAILPVVRPEVMVKEGATYNSPKDLKERKKNGFGSSGK